MSHLPSQVSLPVPLTIQYYSYLLNLSARGGHEESNESGFRSLPPILPELVPFEVWPIFGKMKLWLE